MYPGEFTANSTTGSRTFRAFSDVKVAVYHLPAPALLQGNVVDSTFLWGELHTQLARAYTSGTRKK